VNWSYLVQTSSNEFAVCIDMDEGGATRGIPADEELMVDWGTYCQDNWYELGICKQG